MSGPISNNPRQLSTGWFFLAHEEKTGKSLLSPLHAGIGLGAALLSDLLVGRFITIRDEQVVAITRKPPAEVLAHQVLSVVTNEPEPLSIRMWLSYLARTAQEDVGKHLERTGYVHSGRSLLRRSPRWIPVDANASGRPALRLRSLLDKSADWTLYDVLIAELSDATSLLGSVLDGPEARAMREELAELVPRLPSGLDVLMHETHTAISSSVLSAQR